MLKTIRSIMITLTAVLVLGVVAPNVAQAHCQVPCGIYNDHMRVMSMLEDAATIEKAAKLINELAGKQDAQSQNQLVRWVNTKEDHAQKTIETMSNYFLTQRVKTSQADYSKRLQKHHAVILAAMKAKQKADVGVAQDLTKAIKALEGYYPEHKH